MSSSPVGYVMASRPAAPYSGTRHLGSTNRRDRDNRRRRDGARLDDGDNVYISWRWPNKSAATFLVYVDHNMGTIVKAPSSYPKVSTRC